MPPTVPLEDAVNSSRNSSMGSLTVVTDNRHKEYLLNEESVYNERLNKRHVFSYHVVKKYPLHSSLVDSTNAEECHNNNKYESEDQITPTHSPLIHHETTTPFFNSETKKFVHFSANMTTSAGYSLSHSNEISPLSPYSPNFFTTASKDPHSIPTLLSHTENESLSSGEKTSVTRNGLASQNTHSPIHSSSIRPKSYGAISPSRFYTTGSSDSSFHTQLFILAIAFLAIWSPQNLMAPNLTQIADSFGFDETQRDLYLGAYLALATGVLSLPISALLGFLVDSVSSRKRLFAWTLCLTGISSIATGSSKTYLQLFFSRLVCGGCMSGSISIIFSLMGDLFDPKDRNIASSGLTAMMGAGILFGQVYAGTVGASAGWHQPFLISGFFCIICGLMVFKLVREPLRGGKEKVLQALLANGTRYDRKLTKDGFIHAMTKNITNVILMLHGFLSNVPWGIIFTFLNDYLSQEQCLTVPEATFLVFWFGVGSAIGGVLGGYFGTLVSEMSRFSLPLFMASSTFLGIFPFLGLLDLDLRKIPLLSLVLAFSGGCIANLPSVNVRPCLLNVNPPETRAAAMTAANLMIQIARGVGPTLIIVLQKLHGVTRQYSFNLALIVFWSMASVLLLILSSSLPHDQSKMEKELSMYAESKLSAIGLYQEVGEESTVADDDSIVSLEDRFSTFDAVAAQESLHFIGDVLRGMAEDIKSNRISVPYV